MAEHPEIGAIAEDGEIAGVRRVHLAATRHFLYYVVNEADETIDVLAIWSTSREGPDLKPPSNSGRQPHHRSRSAYYRLEKRGGRWEIVSQQVTWVS